MIQKIGSVSLDYEFYPGEDFYCDGAVEDEMLEIVKHHPASDFPGIIEARHSWPILYHLSDLRENIVEWLPMDKSMKVLEVGSGCGAITGCLARKAGSVTCLELSEKRSLINAYRHQDCGNVTIKLGNFQDMEPTLDTDYDYITLTGVFEYGQSYINSENPFVDYYNILKKHIKPDGHIVIAIENKMGLKYWAGCKEDHLSTFFSGLEDYPEGGGVRTFTRNGLEKIFKECGETSYQFYYPYPDYKFMTTLYSDRRLPQVGELSNNLRNFDQERLLLFDEKKVFDMLIREDLFAFYSNSYLVVTGPRLDLIYSRFSNDRAPAYAIRTDIVETEGGRKTVRKMPAKPEAQAHVDKIWQSYEKLCARYAGSPLHINACRHREKDGMGYVELEYLEQARTLEELLDNCLKSGDTQGFYRLWERYLEAISYQTPGSAPVSDFDLIFANIMVQGENWTVIDYEWVLEEEIPARILAFRALHCYLLENEGRGRSVVSELMERLGMTPEEAQHLKRREKEFQRRVTGGRTSISDLRHLIGNRAVPYQEFFARADRKRVEIFEDFGGGYTPEHSFVRYDAYEADDLIHFTLPLRNRVAGVRLDPAELPCLVRVRKVCVNGQALDLNEVMTTNGLRLEEDAGTSVFFETNDPNLCFRLDSVPEQEREGGVLEIEAEIAWLSGRMMEDLKKKLTVQRRKGFGFRR